MNPSTKPNPHHCQIYVLPVHLSQRRRINTEKKAKVVAAVWGGGGGEFIKFLAGLAVLHGDGLKNRIAPG